MNIRGAAEQWEEKCLGPYAAPSRNALGRDIPEELCDIQPGYQRDRNRITHCKASWGLKHKTQVFLAPEGGHCRTRLTHTLEVAQIARIVSKALWFNENLTETIALNHDLGHIPFGHSEERALNGIYEDGFVHYQQSIRVVEKLEKNGKGLNLTEEVRDDISNHHTSGHPSTLEDCVVRLSDKIAYISHDIDDTIRAKIFMESDLSEGYTGILGHSIRGWLNTLIHDIIESSLGKPEILMSPEIEEAMKDLRSWMFENVYKNEIPKAEEGKAQQLTAALYDYYMKHVEKLPEEYLLMMERNQEKKEWVVCGCIADVGDSHIIDEFEELFAPRAWKVLQTIRPAGNVTPHRIM